MFQVCLDLTHLAIHLYCTKAYMSGCHGLPTLGSEA
jgi:hypothetical protein